MDLASSAENSVYPDVLAKMKKKEYEELVALCSTEIENGRLSCFLFL